MKNAALILFFLSSSAFGQIDKTGFNEMRLGKSYDDVKKHITLIKSVPDYASFAPFSLEDFMMENGGDSTGYSEMIAGERQALESGGNRIVWCTFNNKKDVNFFGYPIECGQLIFTEDGLTEIAIVFHKIDMTTEAKSDILQQIEKVMGEPICAYTASLEPRAFSCSWYGNDTELLVTDQDDFDLGNGESLNISFISF